MKNRLKPHQLDAFPLIPGRTRYAQIDPSIRFLSVTNRNPFSDRDGTESDLDEIK